MYSYVTEVEIEVTNKQRLIEVREELDWIHFTDENGVKHYDLISEDGELDWEEAFDDCKIEGYWYPKFLKDLLLLAECVEGYVEMHYEEGWNFRIVFKQGKIYYVRAEQVYSEKIEEWENLEEKL